MELLIYIGLMPLLLFFLVVIALPFLAAYKVFLKAGVSGWKSWIPVYNSYIWHSIAYGKNCAIVWFAAVLLPIALSALSVLCVMGLFIFAVDLTDVFIFGFAFLCIAALPIIIINFLSFIYRFYTNFQFAKTFGWETGAALCFAIVPTIVLFVLAFDESEYSGPMADTPVHHFVENYRK